MTWEYRTAVVAAEGFMGGKVNEEKLARRLNELGRDGWEAVTSFDTDMGSGQTRDIVVIFKRSR